MNERPLKSYEWVARDLDRQIGEKKWHVGDKLPSVVELAEHYGVGRSTIREALSALRAKGLLDIRQGGGTYIKEPELREEEAFFAEDWMNRAESLRHVLEVRKVLETGCAGLAARHRTEADLSAMRETLERMRSDLNDEGAGEQADIRLHTLIARATHNPALIEMMASLLDRYHGSMKDTRALWFYAERRSAERLLEEHTQIVAAIQDGDERKAAARMKEHLVKVENVLRERKSGS